MPADRKTAAPVHTPAAARWAVFIGGSVALGAAAAISFETLVRLADRLGITPGWLLPAALDVYAATATLTSLLLPANHPARATAMWNARGGLAMSVLANAVLHGLVLAHWGGSDLVLIFISAWPPLIVERLLHLQGKLALPAAVPVGRPSTGQQSPASKAKTGQPTAVDRSRSEVTDRALTDQTIPGSSTAVTAPTVQDRPTVTVHANGAPAAQPSTADQDELIVQIGRDVYEALKNGLGKRPPEEPYRLALAVACAPHVAAGRLPEKPYGDPSTSTAKRVRKAVEDRFPGLSPLHLIREAS